MTDPNANVAIDAPHGPGPAPVVDPYHPDAAGPDAAAPKPRWKRALGWSKWVVSAALIAWVLWRTDLGQVGSALRGANPLLLGAAFLQIPLGVLIGAFRWKWLLAAGGVRASLAYLIGGGCVAAFVRLFLPSTIGGDAVRVYDSWRAGASKSLAVATIGVDRLLGLFALALLACAAMALNPRTEAIPGARWLGWAAAGGLLVVVGWIFIVGPAAPGPVKSAWRLVPGAFRRPFDKLFGALGTFRGKHGVLASVFGMSVVLQFNVVAFYWLIALALGLELTFLDMLAAAPIAVFVMLIPITINGIGLREGIWIVLLGAYGLGEPAAVALSWIELGLFVAFGLLGGIVYAARK